jgi:hypothetical protein
MAICLSDSSGEHRASLTVIPIWVTHGNSAMDEPPHLSLHPAWIL